MSLTVSYSVCFRESTITTTALCKRRFLFRDPLLSQREVWCPHGNERATVRCIADRVQTLAFSDPARFCRELALRNH